MEKLLAISFLSVVLNLTAGAQQPLPDSTSRPDAAVQQAISIFHHDTGLQSQLYNGRTHIRYEPNMIGIPYFLSNDPQTGSVQFENILFEHVPLWYDEVRDKVVVQHFNQISAFELTSERVGRFSIGPHPFIRIVRDSSHESSPPTSFYEVLVAGNVTILARRKKVIAEFIENMEVRHRTDNKESFYALKDGRYYPVNNEHSFLAVLKDKKPEIQQYLKQNKIKFRKTPEAALVKAGIYYNQLTNH